MPTDIDQALLYFIYFLAAVGGLVILIWIAKLFWALIKAIIPANNCLERYGDDTWVVVTGGSDGIGLGFCEQFADLGFNICMIARNQQKMKNALEIISENVKKNQSTQNQRHIKTAYVSADFSKCQQQRFFQNIFKELHDLGILDKVSVLVNNVGISNMGYLHEISDHNLLNQININCVPMTIMTNMMLPSLLKRYKKSAIINVSSFAAENPVPYVSTYSATKAYNDAFSKAIQLEYSDRIDIISLRPLFVESNMSKNQDSPIKVTRNQCAKSTIKYLGIDYQTNGNWVHRFTAYFTNCLPNPIIRLLSQSESKKVIEKERRSMQ